MDNEQKQLYSNTVATWIEAVKRVPGWLEDDVSSVLNLSDNLEVTIPNYVVAGNFKLSDLRGPNWLFTNPTTDISVFTNGAAKCNLNRFCRSLDESYNELQSGHHDFVDVDLFLERSIRRLIDLHPGARHQIDLKTMGAIRTRGYATNVPSSVDVQLQFTAAAKSIIYSFTIPVHTVCPFMLFEADGHSHTQRTYLTASIQLPYNVSFQSLNSILACVLERFQVAQSSMKIPDEAIHVLRAYTVPSYTEDGLRRLLTVLRDTKHEWCSRPNQEYNTTLKVQSLESIFTCDIMAKGNYVV